MMRGPDKRWRLAMVATGVGMVAMVATTRRMVARVRALRHTRCDALVVLTVLFTVLLAGCGGGGAAVPAAALTPSATTSSAGASDSTGAAPTASPATDATVTTTPITGARVAGAQDICAQPASVSAQPPASIPAYPGAQLHASQTSGANAFYGFCTQAAVDAIAQFYRQQLPGQGWASVTTNTIASIQQVSATRNQIQLTVTISPDALTSGESDIFIEAFAQPVAGTPPSA